MGDFGRFVYAHTVYSWSADTSEVVSIIMLTHYSSTQFTPMVDEAISADPKAQPAISMCF